MKRLITICFAGLICLSYGCEKEPIPTYDELTSEHFIYFSRPESDSTDLSFFLYQGRNSIDYPVTVQSTGWRTEDKSYKVSVMPEYTTAEASDFQLPDSFIFGAGQGSAEFLVRLNYSPKLDEEKIRLVLKLEENDNFLLGPVNRRVAVIWFHNEVVQPEWWGRTGVSANIMGPFTAKKYTLFMSVIGTEVDLDEADLSTIRHYALVFKQYLADEKAAGRMVTEENGVEMTIVAGGK